MPDHSLSAEDVVAVARLARLDPPPAERSDLQDRLGAILELANSLATLDLDSVEPLYQPNESHSSLRDDLPGDLLPTQQALQLAPDRYQDFYRVPKIIGGAGGA